MWIACGAISLAVCPDANAANAAPCPAAVATAIADMSVQCQRDGGHPLCGVAASALATSVDPVPTAASACQAAGWDGLLAAVDATLAANGFVLLGEIHDNDTHHTLRAAIIAGLNARKRQVPVVFEQLTADQRGVLAPYAAPSETARDPAAFLAAVDWDRSPWSKMADYRPLLSAAVASGQPVLPGDPGREAMKNSARSGASSIETSERTRLGLDTPLGAALDDASLTEIEEAHCGMMPKSALGGMAFAQRHRDAHLADAVATAAGVGGGAILIAGNGHVRTDRGVPWYLAQRAKDRPILAVMFTETEDGKSDLASLMQSGPDRRPVADWTVVTPRNTSRDPDPCAQMRAAFERMKAAPKPAQ